MQIDDRLVKWDSDTGSIDDRMVKWDNKSEPRKDDTLQNLAGGILRGAGSIGATLLAPVDAAARAMGIQNSFIGRNDRRQAMDQALQSQGVNPDSFAFGAGKIGTEIAGTMGAGGALAKPLIAAANPLVQGLGNAIATGGASAGGLSGIPALAARYAGGAFTGGASAGLVDPDDMKTGALIGGLMPVATKALSGAARTLVPSAFGAMTGAGDDALKTAFKSGKTGGEAADLFRANMRGNVPFTDVLDSAKSGLQNMAAQKQAAYRSGMIDIRNDASQLRFDKIDDAIDRAFSMATYKGQVKNKAAAESLSEIKSVVDEWRNLPGADYHTPEGMDALKQKVWGLVEKIPFEQKTARSAVGGIHGAIKDSITDQAPSYAKVMRDYHDASDLISSIQDSLVGGRKTNPEASIRKLQALMRNNANVSYGARRELADVLEKQGGQQIIPQLAGQALNTWMPRGIQRATAGGATGVLAYMGNPVAAGLMAATSSPRLAGEAAYYAGRAAPMAGLLGDFAYPSAPILGASLLHEDR